MADASIDRDAIRAAYGRVAGYVRRTPVLALPSGALTDAPLALKLEHTQVTGSFKVRGAFNNLLSRPVPKVGIAATSGGNHGAAVAYAATQLGVPSTVFLPAILATDVKIARMRGFGAEVVTVDGTVSDVIDTYERHAAQTGKMAIHPFDTVETLAGQGTVGLEIEEDLPDLDTLFVSVGGGGLIGGIAAWFAGRVKVVAVETEGTASFDHAMRGGTGNIEVSGIAASGLGAPFIGPLTLAMAGGAIAENVVVTDADVVAAGRQLWDTTRLVVEPGAAVALAALTSGAYRPAQGERVGVLLCGGNADPDWFLGG